MKKQSTGNIFRDIPDAFREETFDCILNSSNCKIERIVSCGHASPDNFWYDQEANEWVIIIQGRAGLIFEGDTEVLVMAQGDYVYIPAHKRHRVEWTDPGQNTIWIAVHF